MFKAILKDEFRRHFKQIPFYLFGIILFLMVFMYAQNTNPNNSMIGLSHGREFNNAPIKIAKMFDNLSILCIFFVMVMIGRSVVRDFQVRIHDFFYTSPISKAEYLGGRFLGSYLVSIALYIFPVMAFLLGNLKLPHELQGPWFWHSFLYPMIWIVIPNTLIIGSFIFSLSTLTRQTIYTYLGSIVLILFYILVIFNMSHIKSSVIKELLDPFGMNALNISTQYWAMNEKNINIMPVSSLLILNRVLWSFFACGLLGFTYCKFKMVSTLNQVKNKREKKISEPNESLSVSLPINVNVENKNFSIRKLLSLSYLEWRRIVFHPAFIIITVLGIMQWISNVTGNLVIDQVKSYLFTSWMMKQTEHLWFYMIPVTILFGGLIVWREKEHQTQDIYHSLPVSDFTRGFSKILALAGVQFTYLFISMLYGIFTQIVFYQFYDVEPGLYITRLFLIEFFNYLQIAIMVVFVQLIIRKKILGFFISALLFIADVILFEFISCDFTFIRWAHLPAFTYSNLNGFSPYSRVLLWYGCYWLLFTILLGMITILMWRSSENDSLSQRFRSVLKKANYRFKTVFALCLILFIATGSFIAYNRYGLNAYLSTKDEEKQLAEYEKQTLPYLHYPQPKVTDLQLKADLYPSLQKAVFKGSYTLKNMTAQPIDTLFYSLWSKKRASLKTFDIHRDHKIILAAQDFRVGLIRFTKPLLPGESINIDFAVDYQTRGFTDNNPELNIVKNGCQLDIGSRSTPLFVPQFGINKDLYLSKDYLRKKYGLKEQIVLSTLERADRSKPFSSFEEINYDCILTTEKGQIALTNGELIRQWEEEGRSCYHYKPSIPVTFEIVLTSGKYQVRREKYKNINVEVYYSPKHAFNIDRIIHGFKTSIDLNSQFSEYPHRTLRIVETPAYMSYAAARAYPMMYIWNEESGFIADINDEKDVDEVFTISAHEMSHHWWGYELIPAEAEGLYMPVESMAEFMTIMSLEKEFGDKKVDQLLKENRKKYLKSRSRAKEGETPLARVHHNQSYLAYQKGMIQLFTLKEYIGKENMFSGLRSFFSEFPYENGVYPISLDMIRHLEQVTPDSLRYLTEDLFQKITFYDIKAEKAIQRKTEKGFDTLVKFSAKKMYSDDKGKETEVKFQNHLFIVLYDDKGDIIQQKMIRFTNDQNSLLIHSTKKPAKVGIDPRGLLLDKNPDDNMVNIK